MISKKITRIVALFSLIAVVTLAGCATGRVQVLKAAPSVPYDSLGTVSYFQQDSVGFQDQVLDQDPVQGLREKAAALGADAVIVTDRQSIHPTDEHGATVGSRSGVSVTGIAIRFRKPAP